MSRNLDKNVFIENAGDISQGLLVEKKRARTATFITLLSLIAVTGTQFVNLGKANPFLGYNFDVPPPTDMQPQTITILYPENNTIYASHSLSVNFNVSLNSTKTWYHIFIKSIYYRASWQTDNVPVYSWSSHDLWNPYDSDPYLTEYSHELNLTEIPEGKQNMTITVWAIGTYVENMVYNEFNTNVFSSVSFVVDTTPPSVSVLSPENKSYNSSDVPLNFMVGEPFTKISYVLDGQDNVTIGGNMTLSGLSEGAHNVTVYAQDAAGNVGASETISFSVELPFPTTMVIAPMASVAVIGAGLLVYLKKRHIKSGDKYA